MILFTSYENLTVNMYLCRQKLLLQLEKAVLNLLWSRYSGLEVVWPLSSKYANFLFFGFLSLKSAVNLIRNKLWFCSILRTLFLNFCCLWMLHMLLPVKRWHQQCQVQKVLLARGSSSALTQWWLRYFDNLTNFVEIFYNVFAMPLFVYFIFWICWSMKFFQGWATTVNWTKSYRFPIIWRWDWSGSQSNNCLHKVSKSWVNQSKIQNSFHLLWHVSRIYHVEAPPWLCFIIIYS